MINGGCSDDGFDYFRGWLITQGRETFERVIADPDMLADLPAVRAFAADGIDIECEDALSIAWTAHQEATGEELPNDAFTIRYPELDPRAVSALATTVFCGNGGEERPVLYADSEGGAALVAIGMPELLRLLLVAPWWRDCRAFTAEESAELTAEYLEDMPDLAVRRDRAAAALGLDLPTEAEVLARLRKVATEEGKEFVLIFTPANEPYDLLIKG